MGDSVQDRRRPVPRFSVERQVSCLGEDSEGPLWREGYRVWDRLTQTFRSGLLPSREEAELLVRALNAMPRERRTGQRSPE